MGVTYKAFNVDLHCPVTLKVIAERYLDDESARLRFLRDAHAAARLRHSNIASVLHLGRIGSSCFYAMEFVDETLENLIKRSGRVKVKLALGNRCERQLRIVPVEYLMLSVPVHQLGPVPSSSWLGTLSSSMKVRPRQLSGGGVGGQDGATSVGSYLYRLAL
jgi:hypothetical protein